MIPLLIWQVCGSQCQIVNLGCGFDTLFWRLTAERREFVRFVEMDHAGVVRRKAAVVRRTPALRTPILPLQELPGAPRSELHSQR